MSSTEVRAHPFGQFERMLAGRYLRAKRSQGGVALISIISVIAITLAVFVLITTMSVMNGFRETLLSRILGVNGHVFVDVRGLPNAQIQNMIRIAQQAPNVLRVSPVIEEQALATANGQASGVIVRGVSRDDLEHLTLVSSHLEQGSSLRDFEGVDQPSIVIGKRLAQNLALEPGMALSILSPEGAETAIGFAPRRKAFNVGGIFNIGMAEVDSGFVYMPVEQAQILFSRGEGYDRLEVRIRDPDNTQQVVFFLRDHLGPHVDVFDWRDNSQGLAEALVVERNVMRLILGFIVGVAALNIVTGLIMLVKNKSRDIAVLRTLGATRGAIMRVFFMASASLGLLGVGLGMTLSLLFCTYIKQIQEFLSHVLGFEIFPGTVYSLDSLPAKIDWTEVSSIAAFAIIIIFSSTLATARWASRFDPVEALRYE